MTHFKTTVPGYRNRNGQEVIEKTGFASESMDGQSIYLMHCIHCSYRYGSNGCDIHLRRCPSHQGGAKGERIPTERPKNLFHP